MAVSLPLLLLLAGAPAVAHGGTGWRGDGTGHFPGATPPIGWSPAKVMWRTELPNWSNAAPVVVAGRVCAAVEPTTVFCADANTGKLLWQATNEVIDALPPDQRAALEPKLARAEALDEELRKIKHEYSLKRRELRANPAAAEEVARLSTRMGEIARALDEIAPYRTEHADAVIGFSSPTPVTDGTSLYVFFGNGVVSRFEPDGRRTWTRWLGKHTRELRGYTGTPAASPRIAAGMLIVGYNDLHALDLATGETRWKVPNFADYGAPAVADVDGLEVLFTGDGRAIRARDGAVLHTGLGDLWYVGPVVSGDRLYFAGTTSFERPETQVAENPTWPTWAKAWRIGRSGDTITVTKLWEVQLPSRERYYATPLVWGNRLVVVTRRGQLALLDTANGKVLRTLDLTSPVPAEVWASPMEVGGRLVVMWDQGHVQTFDDQLSLLGTSWVDRGLPAPMFVGDKAYVRGRSALFGIDQ